MYKWLTAVVAMLLPMAPGAAVADAQFAEFRGVPEQLAARTLAIDCGWFWVALLLLAVVVMLWAYHRRDRSK